MRDVLLTAGLSSRRLQLLGRTLLPSSQDACVRDR
jgi:hypothetical protein